MRGLVVVATLLAATAAHAQSPGPVTKYQREKLVGWARNHFADPYSLRSTGISNQLMLRTYSGGQHLGICIEYNAKNLEGAYTGVDRFPFIVGPDGRVAEGRHGMLTNTSCYDQHVAFRPFPELMAIR